MPVSSVVISVGKRLFTAASALFVVSAAVFALMSSVAGNVTWTILGNPAITHLPQSEYRALAHRLGVDRPLPVQYWHWLVNALHGNLGTSLVTQQPVTPTIMQRFPVTLSLIGGSLLVSLTIGVALGVISAVRGGIFGRLVDVVAMVGWVLPAFWLAAELVVIFAIDLHWFPTIGYVPFAQSPTGWLRSLVLPVVAISVAAVGGFAKFTREAMLDALSSEYIRMAKANGISSTSIIFRHAFKTASLQIITLTSLLIVGLLAGTVFIETVFALPGMGLLMTNGVQGHDVPLVEGVAVFFTLIVVVVNLLTDLAYGLLNPKVRAA